MSLALCRAGMEGTTLHNPGMVHVDSLVRIAAEHPQIVRGIKCHGRAAACPTGDRPCLKKRRKPDVTPIFRFTCTRVSFSRSMRRTGRNRQRVMSQVVQYLKPGDVLAHVYSRRPDGIMSSLRTCRGWLFEAKAAGVLFDLGHGVNLIQDCAQDDGKWNLPGHHRLLRAWRFQLLPRLQHLDYSLLGGMNKLLGLGMSLTDVVRALTATPAEVLADPSIGHLGPGARANITALRPLEGEWTLFDSSRERLIVHERLPDLVVMDGEVIYAPLRASGRRDGAFRTAPLHHAPFRPGQQCRDPRGAMMDRQACAISPLCSDIRKRQRSSAQP
jgi:dihydroorotase